MPKIDPMPLHELFRVAGLQILLREERIDAEFIRKIIRWRYTSEFSLRSVKCDSLLETG